MISSGSPGQKEDSAGRYNRTRDVVEILKQPWTRTAIDFIFSGCPQPDPCERFGRRVLLPVDTRSLSAPPGRQPDAMPARCRAQWSGTERVSAASHPLPDNLLLNARADLPRCQDTLTFSPDAGDTRPLRNALGCFATGVTIVTAHSPGGPIGMTVNSFSSVSLDPALILWSVAHTAGCCQSFETSAGFSVNVLRENQAELALQFAHDAKTFDASLWLTGPDGLPVLHNPLARFDCTRECLYPGGDHTIIIGRVQRVSMGDGTPLLFCKGAFGSVPYVGAGSAGAA